jgi:hypothetical protein
MNPLLKIGIFGFVVFGGFVSITALFVLPKTARQVAITWNTLFLIVSIPALVYFPGILQVMAAGCSALFLGHIICAIRNWRFPHALNLLKVVLFVLMIVTVFLVFLTAPNYGGG